MHCNAKRQINKNSKLALAWQMHYIWQEVNEEGGHEDERH